MPLLFIWVQWRHRYFRANTVWKSPSFLLVLTIIFIHFSSEAAHFDVHYQATTYYYMAREIVQGTTVKFEYSGRGAYSTSLFGGTTELNLPGYYSLAIRMTKKETKDYLTVSVNTNWFSCSQYGAGICSSSHHLKVGTQIFYVMLSLATLCK